MSGSARPNPPWTQFETLELLTEILKAREVHPDRLLQLILELGEPQWENVALPRGRTLAQCRDMYREYVARAQLQHTMPARPASIYGPQPQQQPDFTPMQHAYGSELRSPLQLNASRYQDIQPRPPNYPGPSSTALSPSFEPPRKKRGRPSKVELEQRRDAARSRGEISPVRRREILPAAPFPPNVSVAAQAAQAVMAAPTHFPSASSGSATPQPMSLNRKRPLSLEALSTTRPAPPQAPGPSDDERTQHGPQPFQQSQHAPQPHPPTQQHTPQPQSQQAQSQSQPFAPTPRTQQRDYPQILSQDPTGSHSTFRAPRGGDQ